MRHRSAKVVACLMVFGGLIPQACTPDVPGPTEPVVDQAAVDEVQSALIAAGLVSNPDFAGAYIDPSTAKPVIMVRGHQAAVDVGNNAEIAASVTAGEASIKATTYSFDELDDGLERLAATLNAELAPGRTGDEPEPWPYEAMIDVPGNQLKVVIDTATPDADAQDAIASARLPTAMVASSRARLTPQSDYSCNDRNTCNDPVRGGVRLTPLGQSDYTCTAGFTMVQFGLPALLTAAHCGGVMWKQGNTTIGPTQWIQRSGTVDAQIIAVNTQHPLTNVIYRVGDHATRITDKITDSKVSILNNRVCSTGGTNGEQCGEYIAPRATYNGLTGLGLAEFQACHGDSGGPVIGEYTNRAYGIVQGGSRNCDQGLTYFTWVREIEKASGARLLLTPTVGAWMTPGTCFGGPGLGADIRYLGPEDTIGNYQNFAGTAPYGSCSTSPVTAPTALVRGSSATAAIKCKQLRGASSQALNMQGLGYGGIPSDAWGCS